METGRENLSLARLAEAHWDAVAILAEAGRKPKPGALYGVWAAEIPNQPLRLEYSGTGSRINGSKMFCSGAGLVDRALVTIGLPEQQLVDIDLRQHADKISFDDSGWKTSAFKETRTATGTFFQVPVADAEIIGESGWYLNRPGFWHGACGPAACWAGGAAGLVDYAMQQRRKDTHTLAHLGAMYADVWSMLTALDAAGREIDECPDDAHAARTRARTLRHLVEQACTDILRRLTRAFGPYPLAMDEEISRRCQELDLYLRQCHAERDLEALGQDLRDRAARIAASPLYL
jgi:alkylation response protein AidB-like acyl-CoA dehydrogenase